MPVGMYLRSPHGASNLSGPNGSLQLVDFEREHGLPSARPLPLATFVDYADWFRAGAVPGVDDRLVTSIERDNGRFTLTLEDGEPLHARRVVIAAGIAEAGADPGMASPLIQAKRLLSRFGSTSAKR